jgi:hypothetical protein
MKPTKAHNSRLSEKSRIEKMPLLKSIGYSQLQIRKSSTGKQLLKLGV